MGYSTVKIKLQETGKFNSQNLVLGNKFNIVSGTSNSTVHGIINSIFIVITSPTIKLDIDLLFFNSPMQTITENGQPLILTENDATNCFGKLRIESNGDMADDYLNPIGGYHFAHMYNMNLPYYGKTICGVAIYQDIYSNTLDNNIILTVNHDFRGNIL